MNRTAKNASPCPTRDLGNKVEMEAKRFGYFPQTFVWRGRRFEVQAVERCWSIEQRWVWNIVRNCFRVTCAEGSFDLSQNIKNGTWRVDKFEKADA